jgi:hypothetical protein
MGISQGQYNLQVENKNSILRELDLKKLDNSITIKSNELKAMDYDVKSSELKIEQSRVTYEVNETNLSIGLNGLDGLKDKLKYEQTKRLLTQQTMTTDLSNITLELDKKQAELSEKTDLFKLQHPELNNRKYLV